MHLLFFDMLFITADYNAFIFIISNHRKDDIY